MSDTDEIGRQLEAAVSRALAELERAGLTAREADEFIRECVFNAWWDWDYEPCAPKFEHTPTCRCVSDHHTCGAPQPVQEPERP